MMQQPVRHHAVALDSALRAFETRLACQSRADSSRGFGFVNMADEQSAAAAKEVRLAMREVPRVSLPRNSRGLSCRA